MEARCDGRSQHQNKATVLEVLRSRIYEKQQSSHDASTSKLRKEQFGSGMRGDKIRTIRYQDNKVKCELTGRT
ncbi:peptide chain release factor-like protein, partial [Streptomyces galilaeus]|uniref:peptide chain release factor-like protein n=1 Tax=Streptomyces galilaeus TaxID=33899 RepID=UPI0038F743D6